MNETEAAKSDHIARLLASVMSARARDRARIFSGVHEELAQWLSDCEHEGPGKAILAPCRDTERFFAQARTYLRALATYTASSDEWLDVFRAFKQLIDHNMVHPALRPPATPLSRLSRGDIEKLQTVPGRPRGLTGV